MPRSVFHPFKTSPQIVDTMPVVQHGNHHYFVLHSPDLAVSQDFFSELLGWHFVDGELTNLAFFGALTGSHDRSIWIHVDDCDESCDRVEQLGGTVDEVHDERSGRNAICRDDQDNRFHMGTLIEEFRNYPHPPPAPRGELSYFTLPVGDTSAGAAFYSALFGWEFSDPGETGSNPGYRHCTNGTLPFGLTGSGDVSPAFYFKVDDVEAAAERVVDLGGTGGSIVGSETGPSLIGSADPAGVRFELWQPAPGY